MIVRQFISWVRTAPAGERTEATRALARAWLYSELSEDDRDAAEGALLMLLDDASPLVRRAMADIFSDSDYAPPGVVAALASDQASVALPVLEFSPLLSDNDLVEIVATGDADIQCAIARRAALAAPVCAAIAEVGAASAALELIESPDAELPQASMDRIVERFGQLAAIREALLERTDLPAATRLTLASRLSDTLANFVAARDWLKPERAGRVTTEAMERSTVNIAAQSEQTELAQLIKHLRATGQLTAGLMLRALLSGNFVLFEEALAELSGVSAARVGSIVDDRGGASLNALLAKASLPASTLIAFRAALAARSEIGFIGLVDGAMRLRQRMVERVLEACEQSSEATTPLLMLLRRFAVEAAREEARVYCDDLVAHDRDEFEQSFDRDGNEELYCDVHHNAFEAAYDDGDEAADEHADEYDYSRMDIYPDARDRLIAA